MSAGESSTSGPSPSPDPLEHRSTVTGQPGAPRPASLAVGDRLGRYRILRALGRGGMGEVYEAEDPDAGRRVAVKVLLDKSPTETGRERFLREGRLAAAINHPNTVYVFGSEEIDGRWAISMEVAGGGTLRDLVRREGPLPSARAVDLVLQVVDGLEAAHAVGVLHRDVKPSNCFLQSDGTVKVGDFGLSLSTLTRESLDLTGTGTVVGTPEFAAPEQLRGDEIDVRADVYSVSATLYYLLTGRPPFAEHNLARLLEAISTRAPESPSSVQRDVPPGLSAIVLACLAKDPEARIPDCASLRVALQPFSSRVYAPPSVGRRAAAVILDGLVAEVVARMSMGIAPLSYLGGYGLGAMAVALPTAILGRSLGELACGLVVTRGGVPASPPWALARGALHGIAVAAAALTLFGIVFIQAYWIGPALLVAFLTGRSRGGWQGLAERATRTHVTREVRPVPPDPVASPANVVPSDAPQVGSYAVLRTLHSDGAGELLEAVDPVLRRRVWIRRLPAGSPSVEPWRRELLRPARLRWLMGRRDVAEAWDAYGAPAGAPLMDVVTRPRPWAEVRVWLLDLADELSAQEAAGEPAPPLSLRHVWVGGGHARLLDFPGHGGPPADHARLDSPQRLLYEVAKVGLFGGREAGAPPLPRNLRHLLKDLRDADFASLREITQVLRALAAQADRVTATDRLEAFTVPAVIATVVLTGLAGAHADRLERGAKATQTVPLALMRLHALDAGAPPGDARERRTLERHVVLNYETLRSGGDEPAPYLQAVARRVLEGASAGKAPPGRECELPYSEYRPGPAASFRLTVLDLAGRLYWGLPALVLATLVASMMWFPIGRKPSASDDTRMAPLHVLRVGDLVRPDGTRAPTHAAIARNVLRWVPLAVLVPAYWWGGERALAGSVALVIAIYGIGIAWTLLRPEQGPLELLTNTAVVPRDFEVDIPGRLGKWETTPVDWPALRRLIDAVPFFVTQSDGATRLELQGLMAAAVAPEPVSASRGRLAAAAVLLATAGLAALGYGAMRSGLPPTPGRPSQDCWLKTLREGAAQGGPHTLLTLGRHLERGDPGIRDLEGAHQAYAQAARLGDVNAACELGRTYEFGVGVVRAPARAAHWYRQAADKGHREAQRRLGALYLDGAGVEWDPLQARRWLEKAAVSDRYAPGYLGYLAEGSDVLPANRATAERWYRVGAERGDPYAMHGLARLSKDEAEARAWNEKAARAGDVAAALALGHTPSYDPAAAGDWFRRAAIAGNAEAQFHLGRVLFSSSRRGAAAEAWAWLTLASRSGRPAYEAAGKAFLERLEPKLTAPERAQAEQLLDQLTREIAAR